MVREDLIEYLKNKRGEQLDFFECRVGLDYRMFDTVCAFLNTKGGLIVLGVKGNNDPAGIDPERIDTYMRDIIRASNDPGIINPPFILHPETFRVNGKNVIAIWVPVSSQVHKCNNTIFTRVNDIDIKAIGQQIDEVYNRKRNFFTENTIYPFLGRDHFRKELLIKSRNLIRSHNPDHPWLSADDEELLRTAGLHTIDFKSGKEGYTLAAALLFGEDDVIRNILPQYRIDAMVRIIDTDRYDDRIVIQTNLIEAYERLMEFIGKHLNDKFFMEGGVRISLRERIFREVIANLIVHREYTNSHTATLIIYEDRVEIKNANNPRDYRRLKVGSFEPFQKNPNIARFYRILGRCEEIGSGIRNVIRYLAAYSDGLEPAFVEDQIFTTIIPLQKEHIQIITEGITEGLSEGITEGLNEGINAGINDGIIEHVSEKVRQNLGALILFLYRNEGVQTNALAHHLKVSDATVERYVSILKKTGAIEFRGAKKSGGFYLQEGFKSKLK
jgi:ATP-dependent DNA helicase RecG